MFLQNPDISGRMMWESYPVLRLALLLGLLLGAALWGLARAGSRLELRPVSRGLRIAANVGFSVLLVALMWGKWSRYPLRWGEAFEARRSVDAHLALNPLLFFLETRSEMDVISKRRGSP